MNFVFLSFLFLFLCLRFSFSAVFWVSRHLEASGWRLLWEMIFRCVLASLALYEGLSVAPSFLRSVSEMSKNGQN